MSRDGLDHHQQTFFMYFFNNNKYTNDQRNSNKDTGGSETLQGLSETEPYRCAGCHRMDPLPSLSEPIQRHRGERTQPRPHGVESLEYDEQVD